MKRRLLIVLISGLAGSAASQPECWCPTRWAASDSDRPGQRGDHRIPVIGPAPSTGTSARRSRRDRRRCGWGAAAPPAARPRRRRPSTTPRDPSLRRYAGAAAGSATAGRFCRPLCRPCSGLQRRRLHDPRRHARAAVRDRVRAGSALPSGTDPTRSVRLRGSGHDPGQPAGDVGRHAHRPQQPSRRSPRPRLDDRFRGPGPGWVGGRWVTTGTAGVLQHLCLGVPPAEPLVDLEHLGDRHEPGRSDRVLDVVLPLRGHRRPPAGAGRHAPRSVREPVARRRPGQERLTRWSDRSSAHVDRGAGCRLKESRGRSGRVQHPARCHPCRSPTAGSAPAATPTTWPTKLNGGDAHLRHDPDGSPRGRWPLRPVRLVARQCVSPVHVTERVAYRVVAPNRYTVFVRVARIDFAHARVPSDYTVSTNLNASGACRIVPE